MKPEPTEPLSEPRRCWVTRDGKPCILPRDHDSDCVTDRPFTTAEIEKYRTDLAEWVAAGRPDLGVFGESTGTMFREYERWLATIDALTAERDELRNDLVHAEFEKDCDLNSLIRFAADRLLLDTSDPSSEGISRADVYFMIESTLDVLATQLVEAQREQDALKKERDDAVEQISRCTDCGQFIVYEDARCEDCHSRYVTSLERQLAEAKDRCVLAELRASENEARYLQHCGIEAQTQMRLRRMTALLQKAHEYVKGGCDCLGGHSSVLCEQITKAIARGEETPPPPTSPSRSSF